MYASSIKVDWDDAPVGRATVVNKKIWNAQVNEFQSKVFIRVNCGREELRRETEWMQQQFGPPRYQGSWWVTELTNDLWMTDSLATFWYLKHGK